MPAVTHPAHKKGDFLVDYEEKVFEDVKAEPGEKALVTFHTVAFEGSIGFVNLLQATRLQRKGFETSVLLYGPGVTLGVQRGFPTLGDEAFPGHQNFNNQITKFMAEGGKVYACRFALQALYGHGEGVADRGHPADQPARRARHRAAAQGGQRVHPRHLDALTLEAGRHRPPTDETRCNSARRRGPDRARPRRPARHARPGVRGDRRGRARRARSSSSSPRPSCRTTRTSRSCRRRCCRARSTCGSTSTRWRCPAR